MLADRIARARSAAGLSLRGLAERVGVSHTAISKYERGELTPDSETLRALGQALGVRVEYFFRPDSVHLGQVEYRKRTRLGARALAKIQTEILDQAERLVELLGFFPDPPLPAFLVPELPAVTDLDDVEEAALALRDAWDLGDQPIADLVATLEDRGLLVLTTPGDAEGRFDGLAAEVVGRHLVVVGADWPGDRQRFTLAHELGHLVLAGRVAPGVDEERVCNCFAGAFLAPRPAVWAELGQRRRRLEERELLALKHEYGLSMAAWTFRARDTDVIDAPTFEVLQRTFRARGWHKQEPGEPVAPERPSHFRRLVLRALAEDLIGEAKAAELVGSPLAKFRAWRAFLEGDRAPARSAHLCTRTGSRRSKAFVDPAPNRLGLSGHLQAD
jgi:Zn-dependent peptidase ImmA (M78 family)/DNA-binding XRE family transcriptional regulator